MSVKKAKPDGKIDYRFLKAVDITPKDDAFHGNINLLDIEWWYFDAVFDNGYSLHVGVRTYHIRNSGIMQSRINVYKEGKTEVKAMKTNLFSNFYTSYDQPRILINDKPIIEFDQEHYKKTREWRYHVLLTIDHHEVDLVFTGTTQGWKIETSDACWTVALTKARVTGTIKINDHTMKVKGTGYHDHNWGYSPNTAVKNLGWFWGRISGDTLNITWSKTMQTDKKGDLLAIVNQDKNGIQNETEFYSINPACISFSTKKFVHNNRRLIPTEFDLQITDTISDNKTPVNADIHMKTLDIQHTRIFTIHYWRYHGKATGKISVGSTTETLDEKPQIIEFLSFKS